MAICKRSKCKWGKEENRTVQTPFNGHPWEMDSGCLKEVRGRKIEKASLVYWLPYWGGHLIEVGLHGKERDSHTM